MWISSSKANSVCCTQEPQLTSLLSLQGGFEYKRAIVDCIISIIEENPESKETGLAHLCEFIEDCEHTVLATKILHLLGKEGPRTPQPSKYIRFIFNRVVLESEAVRAGNIECDTVQHYPSYYSLLYLIPVYNNVNNNVNIVCILIAFLIYFVTT